MAKKIKQRCYPNINGGKYLIGELITLDEVPGIEFCLIKEGKSHKMIECSTGLSLGIETANRESAIESTKEKITAKYVNGETITDIIHRAKSNFQHFIDEKPMRLEITISREAKLRLQGVCQAYCAIRKHACKSTIESMCTAWAMSGNTLQDLIDCEVPADTIKELQNFIPSLND